MDDPPGGDGSEAGLVMISQVPESRCPREEKPVRLMFCLLLTVECSFAALSVYMALVVVFICVSMAFSFAFLQILRRTDA